MTKTSDYRRAFCAEGNAKEMEGATEAAKEEVRSEPIHRPGGLEAHWRAPEPIILLIQELGIQEGQRSMYRPLSLLILAVLVTARGETYSKHVYPRLLSLSTREVSRSMCSGCRRTKTMASPASSRTRAQGKNNGLIKIASSSVMLLSPRDLRSLIGGTLGIFSC